MFFHPASEMSKLQALTKATRLSLPASRTCRALRQLSVTVRGSEYVRLTESLSVGAYIEHPQLVVPIGKHAPNPRINTCMMLCYVMLCYAI